MGKATKLRIYLDDHLRQRVGSGGHNFLGHVIAAFEEKGWEVLIRPDSDEELLKSRTRPGHSLFHMIPPGSSNGLTFRLAYVYPFWKIEKTATRWGFESAHSAFDPATIDGDMATRFVRQAKNRLFPWAATTPATRDVVFIPLQGRLLQKRDHQFCSPLEMVKETLAAFPDDPVVITLHPRETYTQGELEGLNAAIRAHPQAAVRDAPPESVLPKARIVVAQNSAVAFTALFLGKPIVLFARSDFHHIAANVRQLGVQWAFSDALTKPGDFEKYLYWFLQLNAINAGRQDVREKVISRVTELGWNV